MEYKTLFLDTKIPVIWLGTWWIWWFMQSDFTDDKKSINTIKEAIKLGYTHIDTAELYGAGHSEELIGEAIQDFDRKQLFITSKVFKTNLRYDDLIKSAKESLKRLKTSYIDLYMIHVPNPEIDIKETMKAMDYLVEKNIIKYIWVSNFNVKQLKEAQSHTKNKIVANQIEYNLVTRTVGEFESCTHIESETIPYCQNNDIIIVAYRPIERGVLLKNHPLLDNLSKKYNKTKSQIAINWLISKKNIITIPKSLNKVHLIENLWALWWKLEDEDMRLLDETDFNWLKLL